MANDDTPLTPLLRDEILKAGPISFERFMDQALYHPEHGYYRNGRDPFGKDGDFYTAAQLQPVFGDLIRAVLEKLSEDRSILDLGAGRGEMEEAFQNWNYVAVDAGQALPSAFQGVIFANELFDALPFKVFGDAEEALVDWVSGGFAWTAEPRFEVCDRARDVAASIASAHSSGVLMIIDYGYDERERVRFPAGTLMSYRKHVASEDVLRSPGSRDITAHVNFTSLERELSSMGYALMKRTSLSSLLLSAGEGAIEAAVRANALATKTLLFGMGDAFQAMLLEKSR